MPSTDPSLIAGLDPAALFGLSADEPSAAGLWQPPTVEEAAKLFPTWKMLGLLGRGGMGAVYHVHQPDLDREVAVKLLPIEASRDERQVERFRREARTLAKLKHPGIVALHEAGTTPAGHFFFVMEYINGHPLSELIAKGKVDVPRAIDIVREVCDALAYAHAQGIVHRDIKPSNILIDQDGHARVADFGLARWDKPDASGALELSQTGMFMGTPAYTAPEQARDAAHADHRADLYSLGVLLYEMLTGELPRGVFQPPSRKAGTDARLDNVVQRALQERPEDRYQAASELKNDVTGVRPASENIPSSAKRSPWAAMGVAALVLIAVLLFGGWLIIRNVFETLDPRSTKASLSTSGTSSRVVKSRVPESPPIIISPTPRPTENQSSTVAPANVTPTVKLTPPINPTPSAESAKPSPPPASPNATAKVWSINPLPPALSPPAAVMKLAWKDCVLSQDGGAVLVDDQSVFAWHRSLDGVHRVKVPGELVSLGCNRDSVAMLDRTGQVWTMQFNSTSSPVVHRTQVASIVSSAGASVALVTKDDQAWLSSLQMSTPDTALPFQAGMRLAIATVGKVFGLDANGVLLGLAAGSQQFTRQSGHTNLRKLAAWSPGVLLITADERVEGFDLKEPVPSLQGITEIITGDGFAVARDWKNKLTIWGSAVPDSPQRMSMPPGTKHLTASPLGLIAAW